ncbi:MAG TPA: plastocyanin/azurin family copper-binding protein [Gemmatimonadaceae bacterium]|jgi:plastocyanin
MFATLRSRAALAGLVLLAACGGGGGGYNSPTAPYSPSPSPTPAPTAPAANEVIATTSNTFTPGTLTVSKGTTVTFTFQSTTHNVIFANVAGAPANIGNTSNSGVQRVFSTAGTFGYDCSLHSGMVGTVVVN